MSAPDVLKILLAAAAASLEDATVDRVLPMQHQKTWWLVGREGLGPAAPNQAKTIKCEQVCNQMLIDRDKKGNNKTQTKHV